MDGPCFVYVIVSTVRRFTYAGLTLDVSRRIEDHNTGRNRSTAPYRPYDLLFVEEFPDRRSARQREKFLKSGQGREFVAVHRVEKYGRNGYPFDDAP